MMVLAALREIRGPTDNTIQHEMQTTVRFNAYKHLHRPTFGNKNYHSYTQSCSSIVHLTAPGKMSEYGQKRFTLNMQVHCPFGFYRKLGSPKG